MAPRTETTTGLHRQLPHHAASRSIPWYGQRDAQILAKQDNPHVFALGLKDACCEEPCCCIVSALGAPFGCTACWARKAVLEKYSANGLDDYVCCQGYIPQICCCDPSTWCAGSRLGLAFEGLCCPVFSLSLARLHMMDAKQNRPDPCDYQIIWCSNILQLVSCVLDVVAIFVKGVTPDPRPPPPPPRARGPPPPPPASPPSPALASSLKPQASTTCVWGHDRPAPLPPLPPGARPRALVDLVADLFTCSVAGCMGAQVYGIGRAPRCPRTWQVGAHTGGSRTHALARTRRDSAEAQT